jgi:hypothetical protein
LPSESQHTRQLQFVAKRRPSVGTLSSPPLPSSRDSTARRRPLPHRLPPLCYGFRAWLDVALCYCFATCCPLPVARFLLPAAPRHCRTRRRPASTRRASMLHQARVRHSSLFRLLCAVQEHPLHRCRHTRSSRCPAISSGASCLLSATEAHQLQHPSRIQRLVAVA